MLLNELELLCTKEGQLVRHLDPVVKTSHKLSFFATFLLNNNSHLFWYYVPA